MIEEQVEVEVLGLDLKVDLAPDERKADAELEEELLDVLDEPLLELTLTGIAVQGQEVEDIRVFESLVRQVGRLWRQRTRKVREGLAAALVKSGLDLSNNDILVTQVIGTASITKPTLASFDSSFRRTGAP